MKKLMTNFLLIASVMMFSALNAMAVINSSNDIEIKMNNLNQLASYDFMRLINKTELVGERRQLFDMMTAQYQNEITRNEEKLKGYLKQINDIDRLNDITDQEKLVQINQIYQDADSILFDIDSKTMQYLYSARRIMPTLTYQRYAKKFRELYNNLEISSNKLTSK